MDRIDIGCAVTREGVFDFLILYESLVESWTCYPFTLHAFAADEGVVRALEQADAERVRIHDAAQDAQDAGLERCIVTAPTNVFLAELPELWFLLDAHDRVFVGDPDERRLWSFRQSEAKSPKVKVLGTPGLNPYALAADRLRQPLLRDPLGFLDEDAGQVKVLHLPGLEGRGSSSLADRLDLLIDRFPLIAPLIELYGLLAKRAARRLEMPVVDNVRRHVRDRLIDAGHLPIRDWLPELLNRRGLTGVGVEIGVKRGNFSEKVLRSWQGRKLISVDAWLEAPPDEYMDVGNAPQQDHELFYRETTERLSQFGERSEVWRTTSVEAAARVEPASLDFVYIDARHDYDSVKEDLEAWFDKLRPGGILAGHDYVDGTFSLGVFGVKSAVDDFFGERGLPVKQTYLEGARPGMREFVETARGGKLPSWLVELPRS